MRHIQRSVPGYRPEIDGLRALAIIPVILFHAGLNTFSGGFVGVDVFFVISGYLITQLLLADHWQGRMSLARFYERRARRILPALLAVTLLFSPLALLLMAPWQAAHFGRSVLALTLFGSNFYFWKNTGYFAPEADTQPLLHTWSLAVEEQFYIGFPLLLMVLLRWGRRTALLALLALTVASLLLAQWQLEQAPAAAYFLLPARAWELLLGVLLALLPRPAARAGRSASWLAAMGLVLVGAAIVRFDRHTPHPGVYTLVPTLGAALLIRYASPANPVGRLLGGRLPVGIGLLSYSAYLIHQPLFAFARLMHGAALPLPFALGLALLVLPLAYLSWRFIETPGRTLALPRRQVFKNALAGLVLSSPRERGSTPADISSSALRLVFPARAGIYLSPR